jgi:hypothetical protein
MKTIVAVAVLLLAALPVRAAEPPATELPAADQAKPLAKSSVGLPQRINQIVLPGTELEVKPSEDHDEPLVVRLVATYKHGTAFRYDLEFYCLEPGKFDLRQALRRKDGTSTDDLPPLPVEFASLLPAGQILPAALVVKPAPKLGGYRLLLAVLGVVWVLGLAAILLVGRHRKRALEAAAATGPTLADQLRPLVAAAMSGQLSTDGQAQLERLLLSYWSRRLQLTDVEPADAIAAIRRDEQAGELLRQVEAWLHRPGGAGGVDVSAMLAPYRDLPAEIEAPGPRDQRSIGDFTNRPSQRPPAPATAGAAR